MDEIISITNLFFSYNNKDNVLNNISLNIKQGEFISIIGPNGSGKSTLVKLFNGILTPNSGQIRVMGYLTNDIKNLLNIRKNVAMVFQNPENQIVATIVEEDVAFALENIGTDPNKIRKMVDESLSMVGMIEYKKHSTYQLSGGQKQKVAIAGAISMMPKCIVFDEATSMLDPSGRKDIMNLMVKLAKNNHITIIFVTHFMEEACLADRLIVMDKGKVVVDKTPIEIFSNEDELIKIGLELPKATELCFRLKKQGYTINKPVITIKGAVEALDQILKENKLTCQ